MNHIVCWLDSEARKSKPVATIRIILHGKAAADPRLRAAVEAMRTDGHVVEVRVTWEPGDATRLTAEAVAPHGGRSFGSRRHGQPARMT